MSDVPEVVRRPSSPGVVVVTMAVLFPIVLLGVGTPIGLTHLLTGEGIIAAIANIIVRAMVVAVVLFYDLREWHSSRRTTTLGNTQLSSKDPRTGAWHLRYHAF